MIDIYPAIDIYNGEAVSLENGDIKRKESFGDPLKFAIDFSEISGNLHIVDLNGAFTGNTANGTKSCFREFGKPAMSSAPIILFASILIPPYLYFHCIALFLLWHR